MPISSKIGGKIGAKLSSKLPKGGIVPFLDALNMKVGTNLAWINSWSNAWVFANLMYHAISPERIVGTTAFTFEQGKLTTASPTDVFRIVLADHRNALPPGTYTVLNPDGLKLAIGVWNNPYAGSYTRATKFTFTTGTVDQALSIFVEGSITNNLGNLAVILPGHLESWRAGNIWNSEFINFHKGLRTPLARMMDWNIASKNFETNWDERAKPNGISLRTPASSGSSVPYEWMCDFSKRLKSDIWVCVPYRATDAYITELAKLLKAKMPSTQAVWIEYGNEIWNSASPWGEGTSWVSYLKNTRKVAIPNFAAQNFTLNGHGLTTGNVTRNYATKENAIAKASLNWRLEGGGQGYVKVIDPNTFELYDSVALTTKIPIPAAMVNLLFLNENEAGKVSNMNLHYSEQCLKIWNIFDAILGKDRYRRVLSSQAANNSITSGRLAVPGIAERASALAIAPYYDGAYFGCRLSYSSGQIIPELWSSDISTFEIGIYPAAATPTVEEVKAGTGAVSKVSIPYTSGPNTYTAASAITGLVNGTTYKVFVVYTENGNETVVSTSVTVSATPGSVMALRSFDQQLLANRIDALENSSYLRSHALLASPLPVVGYEGGLHYHQSMPAEVKAWLLAYQESPQFGEMMRRYLAQLAADNMGSMCIYADVLGTTFSIADSFADISDVSYLALASKSGKVPKLPMAAVSDYNGDKILTRPTFPHSLRSLPVGYSYEIIGGNRRGNFSFSGNVLQMANDIGVNWDAPKSEVLTILASDGLASRKFTLTVSIGDAWYEGDALFAWSSVDDDDTTQINPVIGNPLPVLNGVPATLADDMFGLAANGRYGSTTALTQNCNLTKPVLWAWVMDKGSHSASYKFITKHGSSNFMSIYVNASPTTSLRVNGNVAIVSNPTLNFSPNVPAGKHVLWAYFDPATQKLYGGLDQIENGSVNVNYGSGAMDRALYVGGDGTTAMQSSMKHGSIQILNRAGLTLADAKAIVAKMQAHHGIA